MKLQGKTCLVTGGNSGIGKEAALDLARMGASVTIVSRDRARGEAAVADIKTRSGNFHTALMVADLSSQHEVRRLAEEYAAAHPKLDVLVNNAGAINGERTLTEDGIETTFAVNHLAYFMLANLLLDRLRAAAPSRIVNVASDAHKSAHMDFDNLQGEKRYRDMAIYSQSKLANVMFTYELARRLEGTRVAANAMHPGVVATGFGRSAGPLIRVAVKLIRPFVIDAARGAETVVYLASSPEVEGVSGRYFVKKRAVRSSPVSYDEAAQRRLWEVSETLTGVALQV